jgi:hypothetical protein
MIRLRQVALVARDLEPVARQLCDTFQLTIAVRDLDVAEFGLTNALMTVGDQFIEIISPTVEGTAGSRMIERRGGDSGYMVMHEVDDLDQRLLHLANNNVRIIWSGDFDDIRGRHLHPKDTGGAIVSLDEAIPEGSWRWAGPTWTPHRQNAMISAIAGVTIGANDPAAMRSRWDELNISSAIQFAQAGPRGEGIDRVDLVAADRRRVGESFDIGGVNWVLV